jgi:8-oxo-dGTP pyrophosphatase MutT (NUDIX family)
MNEELPKTIRAAGGIVRGVGRNAGKIAIIRRHRYGDEIALPKGKLEKDETEAGAALREVEEETGLKPVLRDRVGTTRYNVGGQPKTVTYFMMDAPDDNPTAPRDSGEVGTIEWLTPAEAAKLLTHDEDRRLITRAFALGKKQSIDLLEQAARYLFRSIPERNRLDGAIKDALIDFSQIDAKSQETKGWMAAANQHLEQAQDYLAHWNLQQGWVSLHAATRLMLLDSKDRQGLKLAALELRRESKKKLSDWRVKAVADLICDENGKIRADIEKEPMRVVNAMAVRDSQFETDYFKIMLRRRHLLRLFLLLVAFIILTLVLSVSDVLPDPFNKFRLIVGVVLFGIVGATLSVARGLLRTDLSAKIPAQQIGAFVIWMRPAIGAAAALISFVLLNAKVISLFNWNPSDPTIVFAVATLSGFSERFIVGAIEKIGDGDSKGG